MSSHPELKKRLLAAGKLFVFAIVIAFLALTFWRGWRELGEYPWQPQPLWFVAAALLYLVASLPEGLLWHRVMVDLGETPGFWESLRAYYIGHVGKYVPGKAMVLILRVGMIRSHRVDLGIATAGVFLSTMTWMAVGALVAAACSAIYLWDQPIYLLGALATMVVVALPTLPPVFARLIRWFRLSKFSPRILDRIEHLRFGPLALGWITMVFGWICVGLCYWATLRGMGIPAPLSGLPRYVGSVAAANVAGFAAFLLPAGVGVREVFLMVFVKGYFERTLTVGADLAAPASAVVLRLVQVVAEATISGILYLARPRTAKLPPLAEVPSPAQD